MVLSEEDKILIKNV